MDGDLRNIRTLVQKSGIILNKNIVFAKSSIYVYKQNNTVANIGESSSLPDWNATEKKLTLLIQNIQEDKLKLNESKKNRNRYGDQ
ncbi:MAG TPA: hypothetical protein GXX36_15485 [Clostridiaceae bacterium]|nr:hypothetical protein [Clostridiaceae bacterium]